LPDLSDNPITIAVDALAVSRKSAGSFTVLTGLMNELVKICDYRFVIFVVSQDVEQELGDQGGRFKYIYSPAWTKAFIPRMLWQQLIMPRRIRKFGCRLAYSASGYPELFTAVPVVSHQQNLWPFAEPQPWWTLKNHVKSFLRRRTAKIALETSRANVFISDYLKECANRLFPKTRNSNFTVHNAIPLPGGGTPAAMKTEWDDKHFCIAVGSLAIHKNYENLLKAFQRISEKHPDLYLLVVGNYQHDYGQTVLKFRDSLKLADKVFFPGALRAEQIDSLYTKAVFSVNVSYLEGFGLPVLESLAAGCPIVCSDIPAFREIASDAAVYCDPANIEDIAEKIIRLYNNGDERISLVSKGIERASEFSWSTSAEKLLAILNPILETQRQDYAILA
jgi:glycosyltransferase involved in cell wall biosynthesis